MFFYTTENLIAVIEKLDFANVEFDYVEYNDWYFTAQSDDGKVVIIFNKYHEEFNYYYAKSPNIQFNISNVKRLISFRKEIKDILLREPVDTPLSNALEASLEPRNESIQTNTLDCPNNVENGRKTMPRDVLAFDPIQTRNTTNETDYFFNLQEVEENLGYDYFFNLPAIEN